MPPRKGDDKRKNSRLAEAAIPPSHKLPDSFFAPEGAATASKRKGLKPEEKPKESLCPADKIYNQILWNDVFDANDFDLGYEDRFKGIMFMPVLKFRNTEDETSEVPFHRVHLFRYHKQIIWDRDNRVDLMDKLAVHLNDKRAAAEGEAGSALALAVANHVPMLTGIVKGIALGVQQPPPPPLDEPIRDNDDDAAVATALPAARPNIVVATFNMLTTVFEDSPELYGDERLPLIVAELERCDADVIFLQEATAATVGKLRELSRRLREGYFFGDVPTDVNSCQATLSRFPIVENLSFATSQKKRAVFSVIVPPIGEDGEQSRSGCPFASPIVLINVHLVSDHTYANAGRRMEEIRTLQKLTRTFPYVICCGDFNFGDESEEQQTTSWGAWEDAWLWLFQRQKLPHQQSAARCFEENNDDDKDASDGLLPLPKLAIVRAGEMPASRSPIEGFSFDVDRNPLARLQSAKHLYPRRLDRVMMQGFDAEAAKIFADKPTATKGVTGGKLNLFPSDHFGVRAVLKVRVDAKPPQQGGTSHFDPSASKEDEDNTAIPPSAELAAFCAVPPMTIPQGVRPFEPFFRSALCFIPPKHLWPAIDAFREHHDKAYGRWMPHINLIFPFVQPARFTDAIRVIESALVSTAAKLLKVGAFAVNLRGAKSFDARKPVVYLAPETRRRGNELYALFRLLSPLFPQCGRKGRTGGGGGNDDDVVEERGRGNHQKREIEATEPSQSDIGDYTPHLTLGQSDNSHTALQKLLGEVAAKWDPNTSFNVNQLHLIAHLDGTPGHAICHSFHLPHPIAETAAAAASPTPRVALNKLHLATMVMEPAPYGQKPLRPYEPKDPLERWCLSETLSENAREAATHISQLGAMYHIPSNKLLDFLRYWQATLEGNKSPSTATPFYLEEVRGNPFRLYIDLDMIRTTESDWTRTPEAFTLIGKVVGFTQSYFNALKSQCDATCVALQCHGPWDDSQSRNTSEAGTGRSKTGFRLYFQRIFTDHDIYVDYLRKLQAHFSTSDPERKLLPSDVRRDLTWADVLDDHTASWDRARLMGTIKRRRNLVRVYQHLADFDPSGRVKPLGLGDLQLLFGTTVRLWEETDDAQAVITNNGFTTERLFTQGKR